MMVVKVFALKIRYADLNVEVMPVNRNSLQGLLLKMIFVMKRSARANAEMPVSSECYRLSCLVYYCFWY